MNILKQIIKILILNKLSVKELRENDHELNGIITVNNPINYNYKITPIYYPRNIGYICNNNILDDIFIESDKKILLLSLSLPCHGIWFIRYNLELYLSVGFSVLKSSKIILTDSNLNEILININNIGYLNQLRITNSDSIIHQFNNEINIINIYIQFNYNIYYNKDFILKVIKNNFPILSATRIS